MYVLGLDNTFFDPLKVFEEMEGHIKKEYVDRSEYCRKLIVADLRQEKLL
jgi:metal-responsive CopG/Arc/MetJ family transcriptional regulator